MKKEKRTAVYDDKLKIEAFMFEGIFQPFPNHFHEYYVLGFIENGKRCLSCKNKEYIIRKGDIVLFNPGDNHTCSQIDEEVLDYRGLNISKNVMQQLAEEVTGSLATSISSLSSGAHVQSSSESDRIGRIVSDIVDKETELDAMVDDYIDEKGKRIKLIEQLDDRLQYKVLHKRYVELKSLTEIADEENYSYVWISKVYSEAMKKVQNILNSIH